MKINIIAVVVLVMVVIIAVLLIKHFISMKKIVVPITLLQSENKLHIFSSNTLSFNFTDNFYLVNISGLLIGRYNNSARLYYNYNKSIIIEVVQNTTNYTLSYYKSTFIKESNNVNYTYTINNISIAGYNGFEMTPNKYVTPYLRIVMIAGPKNYITSMVIETNNFSLINVSNAEFNTILNTMSFSPSKYLNK